MPFFIDGKRDLWYNINNSILKKIRKIDMR